MPRKMENQLLVSFALQCSSTPVGFVQGFLSKEQCDNNLPQLPDLAPPDYYLFPRLKSALKWRRFCDATDVIKNATEDLNRFQQNGFQKFCQHHYSRWKKCIVVQGDYFEGNVTQMIVLSYMTQK